MSRTILLLVLTVLLAGACGNPTDLRLEDHSTRYHVLRLDPRDRVPAERNQHPLDIEIYKIRGLLSECYYSYNLYGDWSSPIRIFTPKQIDDLTPRLWESLKGARPYERIAFASSHDEFGLVTEYGDVSSGWIFVAGDRWHVSFDRVMGHPFHGGRNRPSLESGMDPFLWEVSPYPGQRFHVDRNGHEHRNALEVALGWPDADMDDLPDWRYVEPWKGYKHKTPRTAKPQFREDTDHYWERETDWDWEAD